MGEPEPESPSNRENILLVEYEKAQDSAEHHDTLLWTVAGLIMAGMASLLGLANASETASQPKWLIPLFGMILCLALLFFTRSFRHIRDQKYDRCKEIETELGMRQHSTLRCQYAWFGCLRIKQIYFVDLVNVAFFLVWIWLLFLGRRCA